MKIRHATALLPLILLVGCALNGENQIRKLDLKGLCTKEQIFQYEDFSWGMDTEETFNQRPKIAQKHIQVKRNFLLTMQKRT